MSASQKDPAVQGYCHPRFEGMRKAFIDNFAERGELGACAALYLDGKPVVDLWGGSFDREGLRPWPKTGAAHTQSAIKALYALAIHTLVDRGELSLDKPVASYWKGFEQAGKESITVRQLVSHHAGLVYLDHAARGSGKDMAAVKKAFELQAPEWPPGTQGAYHSATIVPLFTIFVREATGRNIADVLREAVCKPLGLEIYPSARAEELADAAPLQVDMSQPTMRAVLDEKTNLGRAWRFMDPPPMVATTPPKVGNNYATARAFARLSAALANGGELDGVRIASEAAVAEMSKLQWDQICGLTGRGMRMAEGFFMTSKDAYLGPEKSTFGGVGAGGVLFFADPVRKLGFGYLPNLGYPASDLGPRCRALVDAAYAALA